MLVSRFVFVYTVEHNTQVLLSRLAPYLDTVSQQEMLVVHCHFFMW